MKKEHRSNHVTSVDDNIFLDLGFNTKEADKLKAESRRKIEEKEKLKRERKESRYD